MAILGVLAGVTTIATQLIGGSGGEGNGSCPGQPTTEMQWLLSVVSNADRAAWVQYNAGIDTSSERVWTVAVQTNNAQRLAFEMAGGADCKLTSEGGRALRDYALNLLARYKNSTGQAPIPTVTSTQQSGIRQVGDSIVDYGTAIVQGAISGASGAASAGSGAAQRTTAFAGIDPLILVAIVVGAVILFKKF
jgi:hypothetical protein